MRREHPEDNWSMQPPEPRSDGDEFTPARQIINEARLNLPRGTPTPGLVGGEATEKRRRALAAFLREHGVAVPAFVPYRYGWADTWTGLLANPCREPGADGRTMS